jgi:hypothetical protein
MTQHRVYEVITDGQSLLHSVYVCDGSRLEGPPVYPVISICSTDGLINFEGLPAF